jgi:hypothetical protein
MSRQNRQYRGNEALFRHAQVRSQSPLHVGKEAPAERAEGAPLVALDTLLDDVLHETVSRPKYPRTVRPGPRRRGSDAPASNRGDERWSAEDLRVSGPRPQVEQNAPVVSRQYVAPSPARASMSAFVTGLAGQGVSNTLAGSLDRNLDQNGSGWFRAGRSAADAASALTGVMMLAGGSSILRVLVASDLDPSAWPGLLSLSGGVFLCVFGPVQLIASLQAGDRPNPPGVPGGWVDMTRFTEPAWGGVYREPSTGRTLRPDLARPANSDPRDRMWKLFDRNGRRLGTIGPDGRWIRP